MMVSRCVELRVKGVQAYKVSVQYTPTECPGHAHSKLPEGTIYIYIHIYMYISHQNHSGQLPQRYGSKLKA